MFDKYKTILDSLPPVIGIAPNAFSRVVGNAFLKEYSIICFKSRKETVLIEKDMNVFSVESEYPDLKVTKVNAKEILELKPVQHFIAKKVDAWLLIYKSTKGIEKIAERYGWNVLGNKVSVKSQFENKKIFRESLREAGIEPIEGESFKYVELNEEKFNYYAKKFGLPVVFQIAELTEGGGTGTAFINNEEELKAFIKRIDEKKDKNPIENVTAARFIKGIPTSIAACVTKYGVITGQIQTQILDIPEVRTLTEGSGLFCGHDWSFKKYSEKLQKQACEIAKKYGEYLHKHGYKGIFGLDLITDKEGGTVYPVECNPRFTDAFPVLSMMQMDNGLIPMDLYHILENVGVDYEVDTHEVSKSYQVPMEGSQIILETKTRKYTKMTGEIEAGIYTLVSGKLEFLRPGYRFEHLKTEDEFLVTEGVPYKNTIFKPGARVVRLVSKKAMLEGPKKLTPYFKEVISKIYEQVKLIEIEEPLNES